MKTVPGRASGRQAAECPEYHVEVVTGCDAGLVYQEMATNPERNAGETAL